MVANRLKIIKTDSFTKNLRNIFNYSFAKWGKEITRNYFLEIDKAIIDVSNGIKLTRKNPEFSTKYTYIVCKRHYIFFEFKDDTLIVVNILHDAMSVAQNLKKSKP